MKIKVTFKRPWTGELRYDYCCFSGYYQTKKMEFGAGDFTICDKIVHEDKKLTLYYDDKTLHWNRIQNVPEDLVVIDEG